MYVNKSRRAPLLHFSALCDFFERKKFFKNFNFFPKKIFCAFRALDMAPTLDVPVLFLSAKHEPGGIGAVLHGNQAGNDRTVREGNELRTH